MNLSRRFMRRISNGPGQDASSMSTRAAKEDATFTADARPQVGLS